MQHRLGLDVNAKVMSTRIAANVGSEKSMAVRIMPLFIKNFVMKAVFNQVGEKKSCLTLSNLGQVTLPPEMERHVERLDFILCAQATAPHNCGVLSYGDSLCLNFIRSSREPELEAQVFRVLRDLGLRVEVQTNNRE